jgi:hypothetical protein
MGLIKDFFGFLKIFYGNMYVIKDEIDHLDEKFAKIIQIFKRSDPDTVQLILIWILTWPKADADPQHCK